MRLISISRVSNEAKSNSEQKLEYRGHINNVEHFGDEEGYKLINTTQQEVEGGCVFGITTWKLE